MLAGSGGDSLSLAELLDTYGYLALVVGTFLEGETVVVLAGFAAHRGYLVATAGDAGRVRGDLSRRPALLPSRTEEGRSLPEETGDLGAQGGTRSGA